MAILTQATEDQAVDANYDIIASECPTQRRLSRTVFVFDYISCSGCQIIDGGWALIIAGNMAVTVRIKISNKRVMHGIVKTGRYANTLLWQI